MANCELSNGKCMNPEMRKAFQGSCTRVGRSTVTSWEAARYISRSRDGIGFICNKQSDCPGKTYTVSLHTQTTGRLG